MKTHQEALALLPADAVCSCTFGHPGEGGYVEHWRTAVDFYRITNGSHDLPSFVLDWQCELQPAGYAAIRRGSSPGEEVNCFAYGDTLEDCKRAARRQLQVPDNQMGCVLYGRLTWDPLTAEEASECSSMLDAEWIF